MEQNKNKPVHRKSQKTCNLWEDMSEEKLAGLNTIFDNIKGKAAWKTISESNLPSSDFILRRSNSCAS